MPNALIFGVTGQDGAYLARLLLKKGYTVTGTHQHERQPQIEGLQELGISEQVHLLPMNYDDDVELSRLIETAAPDEIYNLTAQSSVAQSFKSPVETGLINGVFVARLLEILRQKAPQTRFFQASSSEMFGATNEALLSEDTPIQPRNPYGTSESLRAFYSAKLSRGFWTSRQLWHIIHARIAATRGAIRFAQDYFSGNAYQTRSTKRTGFGKY